MTQEKIMECNMDWKEEPDSHGDWLWIVTMECECCVDEIGMSYIGGPTDIRPFKHSFENGFGVLDWEAPLEGPQNICPALMWLKIELPVLTVKD